MDLIQKIKENGLDISEARKTLALAKEKDLMFNCYFVEAIVDQVEKLQEEIKEWERISDKQVEHLTRNGKELIELTEQLEQAQQEIEKYKEIIQRYTFEAAFNEEDEEDDDDI
jgi:chromosome segregation ATPase